MGVEGRGGLRGSGGIWREKGLGLFLIGDVI